MFGGGYFWALPCCVVNYTRSNSNNSSNSIVPYCKGFNNQVYGSLYQVHHSTIIIQ